MLVSVRGNTVGSGQILFISGEFLGERRCAIASYANSNWPGPPLLARPLPRIPPPPRYFFFPFFFFLLIRSRQSMTAISVDWIPRNSSSPGAHKFRIPVRGCCSRWWCVVHVSMVRVGSYMEIDRVDTRKGKSWREKRNTDRQAARPPSGGSTRFSIHDRPLEDISHSWIYDFFQWRYRYRERTSKNAIVGSNGNCPGYGRILFDRTSRILKPMEGFIWNGKRGGSRQHCTGETRGTLHGHANKKIRRNSSDILGELFRVSPRRPSQGIPLNFIRAT